MKHKPLAVLTNTWPRYLQFLRESGLTAKQAVFVDEAERVMGLELSGVVCVGNWRDRPNSTWTRCIAESCVR